MIELPKLFEQTLAKKPSLYSDVRKTFDAFEPWLEQSGMPFFPGFTDHSPRHINDVLKTAAALISDAGHELLSPEDVAVLSIAVLLHDCGMHLTQDGFRSLITTNSAPIFKELGDKPWESLWLDFLAEARRFGEDRLLAIFGDTTPLALNSFDAENLSERDLLLGGEFIRRNHARLAHEIALNGVPTRTGNSLALIGFDADLKDIAGLVARSHGMAIRATFSYVNQKFGRVAEYRNIKAPFLMAVIRIADYVQVQSERALKSLLSVKELRSPVSRQEWRNHFAVSDVTLRHEDPEAMYVHAQPTDARTFLRLEALFKDIQRELDASWAAIGEVYGRLGELQRLGLTIRRIRSNLDDKDRFSTSVSYVPMRAGFQSSGPDLLKLLVGPLYNYEYPVGLRELIQNSIDACRELSDLGTLRKHGEASMPDVLVDIQESEDETGWITVADKGVGMTLDTVVNYFLTAGASFRNSDIWKRQHVDENGNVRVIRGGRFGVGALAAFLLGDEIQVRTRHFDRDELSGIEFSARIDEPLVELRRCAAPAGTSIKVRITNPDVMSSIRPFLYGVNEDESPVRLTNWPEIDWFSQTKPSIAYRWSGYVKTRHDGSELKRKLIAEFVPANGLTPNSTSEPHGWHASDEFEPYEAILWKYPNEQSDDDDTYSPPSAAQVVVNGIRVEKILPYDGKHSLKLGTHYPWTFPPLTIERPSIAIFDPLGVCPINLQRSSVSFERMGKDIAIGKSVLEDYVEKLQKQLPTKLTIRSCTDFLQSVRSLPGVRYPGQVVSQICLTKKGFFLSCEKAFTSLKVNRVFFVQGDVFLNESLSLSTVLRADEAVFLSPALSGEQPTLAWFRAAFGDSSFFRLLDIGFPPIPHVCASGILSSTLWKLASAKGKVNKTILNQIRVESKNKESVTVVVGSHTHTEELISRVASLHALFGPKVTLAGWIVDGKISTEIEKSLIEEIWISSNQGIYLRNSKSKLPPK